MVYRPGVLLSDGCSCQTCALIGCVLLSDGVLLSDYIPLSNGTTMEVELIFASTGVLLSDGVCSVTVYSQRRVLLRTGFSSATEFCERCDPPAYSALLVGDPTTAMP